VHWELIKKGSKTLNSEILEIYYKPKEIQKATFLETAYNL